MTFQMDPTATILNGNEEYLEKELQAKIDARFTHEDEEEYLQIVQDQKDCDIDNDVNEMLLEDSL